MIYKHKFQSGKVVIIKLPTYYRKLKPQQILPNLMQITTYLNASENTIPFNGKNIFVIDWRNTDDKN